MTRRIAASRASSSPSAAIHSRCPTPVVVDELGDRRASRRPRAANPARSPLASSAEPDDRAGVDARRPEQAVAVLARLGERALVRADRRSPARTARGTTRAKTPASRRGPIRARDRVRLLVRVERRVAGRAGASRPSATTRGGARPGGSARPAGRPPASSGRSSRTTLRGSRASRRRCASGRDHVVRRRDDRRRGRGRARGSSGARGKGGSTARAGIVPIGAGPGNKPATKSTESGALAQLPGSCGVVGFAAGRTAPVRSPMRHRDSRRTRGGEGSVRLVSVLRPRRRSRSGRSPLGDRARSRPASVTMNARILLQGHARTGSWAAIEVDLQNDGPVDPGRAADGRRHAEQRPVRDGRRPPDRLAQDLRPPRPAAGIRAERQGRARRQTTRSSTPSTWRTSSTTRPSSSSASSPSARRPSSRRSTCRRTRSARSPRSCPCSVADLPTRDRGLGHARPARLAGHRQQPAHARPARCAAPLDRRRRPPGHRRRQRRDRHPVGLPRRPPPLPADARPSTSIPPS